MKSIGLILGPKLGGDPQKETELFDSLTTTKRQGIIVNLT